MSHGEGKKAEGGIVDENILSELGEEKGDKSKVVFLKESD
jgi:hypothetical protein